MASHHDDFMAQARGVMADAYRCHARNQELSTRTRLRAAFESIYLLLLVIAGKDDSRLVPQDIDVNLIGDMLRVLRATPRDVDALIGLAQWLMQDETPETPPLSVAAALALVDRLRLFAAYHLRSS
ncbi:hypothetical protein QCE49_12570 [Caballeronia sp. LZ008]|uniref:hypothetical protein n=1 Tax=unclassified Caballeronia TaxID=2646786 RepID=UPI0020285590|nr:MULTISPECIES: hypothetical protein [unclassified Caballeronia]MDR5794206.1 hypothetical protein [Caballeronia sp. LZ008]